MNNTAKLFKTTLLLGAFILSGLISSQAQIKHAPGKTVTTGAANENSKHLGGTILVVTKTDDTNGTCDSGTDCSLREAVAEANINSLVYQIDFAFPMNDAGCSNGACVITLGGSEIAITTAATLTINGTGADSLTVSGGNASRVFYSTAANVTIKNVTLTDGNGSGAGVSGDGGAIYADGGALTLQSVHVTANATGMSGNGGGAVFEGGANHQILNSTFSANNGDANCGGFGVQNGSLTVVNTTVSGNTTAGGGGGFCSYGGSITLRSVTVTGNTAGGGGGFYTDNALDTGNSIVAGNTAATNADIYYGGGAFTSSGYNLIGDNNSVESEFAVGTPNGNNDFAGTNAAPVNALLAPLASYGGSTPTCALLNNSPAINNGDGTMAGTPTTDQRLSARVDATDIGAFERVVSLDQNSLPNGHVSAAYSEQLSATRVVNGFSPEKNGSRNPSTSPIEFSLVPNSGQLPNGLTLSAAGVVSGTPTTLGTFTFTVEATDPADGMSGAQKYSVTVLAPTFANVDVAGRVSTLSGTGVRNAFVTLTDSNGNELTTLTSFNGDYFFGNMIAGQTIIVMVYAKNYQFAPQVVTINGDLMEINFTPVTERIVFESRRP